MAGLSRAQIEARLRAAQREAQRKVQAEVARVNRENQRRVDEHNRKVRAHNQKVTQDAQRRIDAYNREVRRVNEHNKRVDAQNRATVARLQGEARASGSSVPSYTPTERALVDRVREQASRFPDRDWDAFLSYARIDGEQTASDLRDALQALGIEVWFDQVSITPGKSQSLQMDRGLRIARCGIALLTPAYLTGRFWTERELGALLHKSMLVPVLHNVTFTEVREYSGILPDLAGFETARDSIEEIAQKIAGAVRPTPS